MKKIILILFFSFIKIDASLLDIVKEAANKVISSISPIETIKIAVDNLSEKIKNILGNNIVLAALREHFKQSQPYIDREYTLETGQVSLDESNSIASRKIKNSHAINKIFGINTNQKSVVNIALCTSGGGYRAMISTLGVMQSLKDHEILDAAQYIATLSGSAWAIGMWISSKEKLDHYIQNVRNNITKNDNGLPAIKNIDDISEIATSFITKFIFGQPLNTTDVWGALIINNALAHLANKQTLKLSHQSTQVQFGENPFPIYTAICPLTENYPTVYEWYEFTPFDVRNLENNNYVKTWAFNRQFKDKKSIPFAGLEKELFPPEIPLSNFLGICGSAFTISIKEVLLDIKKNKKLDKAEEAIINLVIEKEQHILNLSGKRVVAAEMLNPNYKILGATSQDESIIKLIDAGIHYNLPLRPLLQKDRDIDVIIVFDASATLKGSPAFKDAITHAKEKNLNLPEINFDDISDIEISIFKQKDKPTIIYIPFTNDCLDSFCSTFNFSYKESDFDYVFNHAKEIINNNLQKIKDVILEKQTEKLTSGRDFSGDGIIVKPGTHLPPGYKKPGRILR